MTETTIEDVLQFHYILKDSFYTFASLMVILAFLATVFIIFTAYWLYKRLYDEMFIEIGGHFDKWRKIDTLIFRG